VTGPLAQQIAQVRSGVMFDRFNSDGTISSVHTNALAALSSIERHVQDMGLQAFEALRDVEALAENGKLAGGLDEAEALFEEIRDRALAALPARENGTEPT